MKNNEKEKFAFLMAKIETAFFEKMAKETVALYFDYLDDLSIDQISRAINFLIENRDRRGLPTIAEIRKATLGSMEIKAVKAWGELLDATHFKKEEDYKDSLISEVAKVAFGSLNNYFNGDNRNDMADRAHFIKTYQLISNLKEAQKDRIKKLSE